MPRPMPPLRAPLSAALSALALACVPSTSGPPGDELPRRDSGVPPPPDSGVPPPPDSGPPLPCADPSLCDDLVDCTADGCTAGTCTNVLAPGFCWLDAQCVVGGALHPDNACLHCDPAASTAEWTFRSAPCDDGEDCTFDDTCLLGACAGTAYTCPPDAMSCTSAVCLGDGTCAQQFDPLLCGLVHGVVRNASSRVPVAGATVTLRAAGGCAFAPPYGPSIAVATTNALGKYSFLDVGAGSYCVDVTAGGLLSMRSDDFAFAMDDLRLVSFGMQPSAAATTYATVCGRVDDTTGALVGGATVNLIATTSSGTGIVQSDQTSDYGNYCIVGAPMSDELGSFSGWAGNALHAGHLAAAAPAGSIPATSRVTIFTDWTLVPVPVQPVCFADGFETDLGWTPTPATDGVGWNLRANALSTNANVPACVTLPAENEACAPDPMDPEDECAICLAPGAEGCIPAAGALSNAYAGSMMQWFGDPASASFLGGAGSCSGANGGTSAVVLSGSLVSPPIDLAVAGDARLRFAAWWEIESVDPSTTQYDVMSVWAAADPADFTTTLGCSSAIDCASCPLCVGILNPPFDRSGASSEPFSSGGFNAAPVWHLYEFDLSPWAGGTVYLRFRFESVDEQYNGFRGLAVDDVLIVGTGC